MPKRLTFKIEGLKEIISNYNIDNVESFKEFEKGEENVNILVKTKSRKYVLRIYNTKRTEEQILFELSLIDYLYKKKFPIPAIIPTSFNKWFLKYKNHFVVLFSYVEGDTITFSKLNDNQLSDVAYNLSLMHKLLDNFSPLGNKKREEMFWFDMEFDIQGKIFPLIINDPEFSEIKDLIRSLQHDLLLMKKKLSQLRVKICFVHNDFQDGNMKFVGDKMKGIFDFDDCCPGAIVSDVAIAINNFCFDDQKLNKRKFNLFIKNYEKNIRLSDNEKKSIIPLMIHVNSFSIHNAIRLWYSDRKNGPYYKSVIVWSNKRLNMLKEQENDN